MANPTGKGGFVKGFDPRRYILTRLDCQRGYHNAPSKIKARIRGLYKKGKWKGAKGGRVWAEYSNFSEAS